MTEPGQQAVETPDTPIDEGSPQALPALAPQHAVLAQHIRRQLLALERSLEVGIAEGRLEPIDGNANLQHTFAPHVYGRTLTIAKHTLLVGKIHKHAHLNILSKGSVLVLTEGGGAEHLVGPLTMVSLPGTKRGVYTLEETVWTTVHPTDETDLEKIEDFVIAKSFEEYEQFRLTEEQHEMKHLEQE